MKSLAISDRKDSLSSCPALAQTTMGTPHNHYYRWRRKQRNLQRLSSLPPSRIMSLSTKTLVALLFVTCSMTSCVSGFSVVSNNKAHTYQTLQPQTSIRSSYLSVVHVNRPSVRGSRLCLSSSTNDDESSSSSDEEEWQAVLAAFKMYKAAYGNLKVPLRFVVPALPPWPEKAWNLKLGQRVAAIRTTGKYVHDEKRRKILDDMGFVWRIRATKSSTKDKDVSGISFDQIYSALATYKEQIQKGSGPLSVPPSFVVPDCEPWPENTRGLPLGKKLSTIRSKAFLASNPGAKEKLKAIGLQLDGKVAANDARFQMVYDALKRYKEIYGDLLVPQPFVVPENSQEWPENTWGLRLGARVNAIRSQGTFVSANPERKELLNDLGFVWSLPKSESGNRRGRRRKEEIEAMEARAASAEGSGGNNENKSEADTSAVDTSLDSLFGGNFEFAQDDFPIFGGDGGPDSPTWTVEGGSRLDEAARRAEEEAQAAEEYTPPRNLADSLAEAKQRAIDVGVIEKDSQGKRFSKGKREKDIPWFNDDFGDEFVFDDVVEALTVYKSLYGDFSNLTDETFTIPTRSDEFSDMDDPDDMMFTEMDAASRAAAAIARYEQEEDMMADDEDNDDEEDDDESSARPGSTTMDVSANDWPEHLGGMSLGNIVQRIRDGSLEVKHLPERKAKLDELDFDWGDSKYFLDVPFEKAMCAMYAYYLVRGDMFVYEDFVMPDEDPWPKALAGYEIGKAVRRIRELQNFLEAYHPEKVSLLRMIDFIWFPTLAMPLDPNEKEMTPEMMLLSAMGHPDYAKMIDIPMGLPEKIMADGPFFETDDPKYWWRKWHNWDYVQDYWYQQGRRDNAFVLRGMGYPQMADEHEAKYGPGLFKQLNATLLELEKGVEGKDPDELFALREKLQFFRDELTDCTDIHPQDRKALLEDLDNHIFSLTTGNEVESTGEEKDFDDVMAEYEYEEAEEGEPDDEDYEEVEGEEDDEEEDYEYDEEEFDLNDELGFDGGQDVKSAEAQQ